jgi:hypothetical protein
LNTLPLAPRIIEVAAPDKKEFNPSSLALTLVFKNSYMLYHTLE